MNDWPFRPASATAPGVLDIHCEDGAIVIRTHGVVRLDPTTARALAGMVERAAIVLATRV